MPRRLINLRIRDGLMVVLEGIFVLGPAFVLWASDDGSNGESAGGAAGLVPEASSHSATEKDVSTPSPTIHYAPYMSSGTQAAVLTHDERDRSVSVSKKSAGVWLPFLEAARHVRVTDVSSRLSFVDGALSVFHEDSALQHGSALTTFPPPIAFPVTVRTPVGHVSQEPMAVFVADAARVFELLSAKKDIVVLAELHTVGTGHGLSPRFWIVAVPVSQHQPAHTTEEHVTPERQTASVAGVQGQGPASYSTFNISFSVNFEPHFTFGLGRAATRIDTRQRGAGGSLFDVGRRRGRATAGQTLGSTGK
uniref:Transmembrane protein n=1 Tax=Mycena chlorophos TaxID=658473 RepID=A0ABQ0M788_MYCCL|nr:predicted protein [Mycena chlorophos]